MKRKEQQYNQIMKMSIEVNDTTKIKKQKRALSHIRTRADRFEGKDLSTVLSGLIITARSL